MTMISLEQARQHLETLGLRQAVEVLDNTLDNTLDGRRGQQAADLRGRAGPVAGR